VAEVVGWDAMIMVMEECGCGMWDGMVSRRVPTALGASVDRSFVGG
jgi:hypothetical protein